MMRSIWAHRVSGRAKVLLAIEAEKLAAIEAEKLARLAAHEALKRERGKMPHWSTVKSRFPNGKEMNHVLRPEAELGTQLANTTLCGWHQASFRDARLPRQRLFGAMNNVRDFIALERNIACPYCYDVLNDIAVWVNMANGDFPRNSNQFHMQWSVRYAAPACDVAPRMSSGTYHMRDFDDAIVNTNGREICSVCTAIFGRLWGPDRPELAFSAYTTNEEAIEAIAARSGK